MSNAYIKVLSDTAQHDSGQVANAGRWAVSRIQELEAFIEAEGRCLQVPASDNPRMSSEEAIS